MFERRRVYLRIKKPTEILFTSIDTYRTINGSEYAVVVWEFSQLRLWRSRVI